MKASLLCLAVLLSVDAGATELPTGKWRGYYCFAEDPALPASYQVARQPEQEGPCAWAITMNVADVAIVCEDVCLVEERLSFRMDPGEEVVCRLLPGDGGIYTGGCRPAENPAAEDVIRIFMRPPPASEETLPESSETSLEITPSDDSQPN